MRADPLGNYRPGDGFAAVAMEFRRRLLERLLPGVDGDALHTRLTALNDKRNDVVHVHLVRDGYAKTNESLSAEDFAEWKQTYEQVLQAVFEYLSL